MSDVDRIAEAVYAAVAGIVLRGRGVGPQEVVAALDRVQGSLDQVRAYWQQHARAHVAETNLRTEPLQIALSGLQRERVDGRFVYKVHKDSSTTMQS